MPFRHTPLLICALALAACGQSIKDGPPSGEGGRTGGGGNGGTSVSGGAANPGEGGRAQSSGGAPTSGGAASGGAATASGGATTGGATTGGASGGSNTGGTSSGGMSTAGGGATAMGGGVSPTGGVSGNSATGGAPASGGTGSGGAAGGATSSGGRAGAGGASGGASGGSSSSGGAAGATGVYRPCPTNGSPCKIMPFGDSITDGFGTAGAYRVEFFRLAHQASKNITFVGTGSNGPAMVDGVTFPPNHEGHSGYTIAPAGGRQGISPLVATVMPQFTPHIITLMIGTNDAIDNYEMATAPTRLGALIDSIFAQLPNVLLVVAQPIPSQDDALNLRLQTYNAAIPAVVKTRADAGRHILLVDMYTPFTSNPQYKTLLLKDTWHPNETGHIILGARWYSVLSGSL
jgi:hypothetical protein